MGRSRALRGSDSGFVRILDELLVRLRRLVKVVAGDVIGIEAWRGHHGEYRSGLRVQGHHRTLLRAQPLSGGALSLGDDRRLNTRSLRAAIRGEVDQSAYEQGIVGTGELGVIAVLEPGAAAVVGVVAGDRGIEPILGIGALVLEAVLARLGGRNLGLPGGQDGAAILGELRVPNPPIMGFGASADCRKIIM